MSYTSLPTRGPSDLQAAITDVRAPTANELSADSIEAIKDRIIEIGTAVGIDAGTGASSLRRGYLPTLLQVAGSIFPTALGANANDYAPTGYADATAYYLSATGSTRTITGLAGGAEGVIKVLVNYTGAIDILLAFESASSSATNRIAANSAGALRLPPGSVAVLRFATGGGSIQRWHVIASDPLPRTSASAPTVNDDYSAGYVPGMVWIHTSGSVIYVCVSNSIGAAVWTAVGTAASTTASGIVELATNAETITGTDAVRAVTPAGLAATSVPLTRTISTTAPITGGGDLSANRTIAIDPATSSAAGSMSAEDKDLMYECKSATTDGAEDFLNNAGITGTLWSSSLTGAGAGVNGLGSIAGHPGICQLFTGTTTTGKATIYRGLSTTLRIGTDAIDQEWVIRVTTLSTVGEEFKACFGFTDTPHAEPANGIFFMYDRLVSTNWLACTQAASSPTRTSTGVAVTAGDWVRLRIKINAAGTSIAFWLGVNGAAPSLVATLTTTIPAVTAMWGAYAMMLKSAGTTTRNADVDYAQPFYYRLAAAR